MRTQLKNQLSWFDLIHLCHLTETWNLKINTCVHFVQSRTLKNLSSISGDGLVPEKVIFNYSNKVLSLVGRNYSSKVLKYFVYPKKLDLIRHFLMSKEEYSTLKNLSSYKELIVIKPDKGNGVVLLNINC